MQLIRISNLRLSIDDDTPLIAAAAQRLKLPVSAVTETSIVRRAVDARRKNNISFVYTLDVTATVSEGQVLAKFSRDKDVAKVMPRVPQPVTAGTENLHEQPVVVGFGPAGMLAALTLAEHGYRPLVLERGRDVDQRTAAVHKFWETGSFDAIANVQFGEGGAGTFSDGKLTTRVNDERMHEVLDVFISAGAPPEIRYLHKPHVGTDKLRGMVKNIRRRVLALGGKIEFESQVTDIDIKDGRLKGLIINENRYIPCQVVVLGIGHSARDTYTMLFRRGVAMEAKPFSIGVRIEHPQALINKAQYGPAAAHPKLGAADYALVYHDKNSGRTAYSFCMCPGGVVVAAASEPNSVVTNGMSLYARDSGVANSAIVVNVNPADCGDDVLSGIEFQRHYERLAFVLGGKSYAAPIQTVGDFLHGTSTESGLLLQPSYRPATQRANLADCLPKFVTSTLQLALPDFERKIKGFAHPAAVMTGVETRTSAPLRLVRGPDFVSVNLAGLYPSGEGAGYAGGIMSAALDGLNSAYAIIRKYRPL